MPNSYGNAARNTERESYYYSDMRSAEQEAEFAPAPGAIPGARPNSAPGAIPGVRSNSIPGAAPGAIPGVRSNSIPGAAPGAAHGVRPGTKPSVGSGNALNGQLNRHIQSQPNEDIYYGQDKTSGKSIRKKSYEERRRQIIVVAALFLLIYVPSVFNWLNSRNMATDILRNGLLIETINADAIIVRDEELVVSYAKGMLTPYKKEGERVAANSRIATVHSRSSLELIEELKQKNRTIIESQYERISKEATYSREVESVETDISKLVKSLVPLVNKNTLYKAGQTTKEINTLVSKKAEIYGNMPTNDAYINQLRREKESLEERVNVNSNGIFAPSAGYISYNIDNNESYLTLDRLPEITYDVYNKIISQSKNNRGAISFAGDGVAVETGDTFSKIVRTNYFYFVINVKDATFEETFKAGDTVRIRTGTPAKEFENALIVYKSERSDNGTIYAFRLAKYLFDFIDKRVINVDVIQKYQEGLKIPIDCLKDYEKDKDYAYIAILRASSAEIKKVRILAANDEYAIIEAYDKEDKSISLYSTYIRDPVNVEL